MLSKIRVLIVDDSLVACRILSDAISSDPEMEVAGTALSGQIALNKLTQCHPDLVMLDIDMPDMDGLQTLSAIKKLNPTLPVIMCSSLLERGNSYSMKSLLGGASDYVVKPKGVKTGNHMDIFISELRHKIKGLCNTLIRSNSESKSQFDQTKGSSFKTSKEGIEILAIGVSTGGPKALADLLPAFPSDFPMPIVIVQHMPPNFTKTLAESLGKRTKLEVYEGIAGAKLSSGTIWIAPGGFHMTLVRKLNQVELALNEDPPLNSCRPSVDALFNSAVKIYGPRVLSVVLTGMGQDGFEGAKAVRNAGGLVYVQDESSSVVWGMPGTIAKAGLANRVVPLKEMAEAIQNGILRRKVRSSKPGQTEGGLNGG